MMGKVEGIEVINLSLNERDFELDKDDSEEMKEIPLPSSFLAIEGPIPYLEERDVPWKLARSLGWGISKSGFTKDRLIVPMFVNRKVVFWQARDMLNEKHIDWGNKKIYRKVRNPVGGSARTVLYNFDVAKKYDHIVIVEGFMDCVKTGLNVMATNGKKLHDKQIELLRTTQAKKITIFWDRDAYSDGYTKRSCEVPCSAERAAQKLRNFFEVDFAIPPDERDPGSFKFGSKELKRILKSTVKFL
jgi:hypothetical protein